MLQREVAERIGVEKTSVHNWETNVSKPDIRYVPAIIEFLGYNPLPEAKTLADQLARHRTTLGLMQKETAQRLGVDQGTLAKWERGEKGPAGEFLERVKQFLKEDLEFKSSNARRAGYVTAPPRPPRSPRETAPHSRIRP
jgi:transcriptional regulator with XRE-family HTH domain